MAGALVEPCRRSVDPADAAERTSRSSGGPRFRHAGDTQARTGSRRPVRGSLPSARGTPPLPCPRAADQSRRHYNQSIGEALGIVGPEQAGSDYATLKPAIKAVINGTAEDVDWNWSGYRTFLSQCEIQVDRDDTAGWVLLAIDTTPGYTDTHPFPAKSAKWQYRAICHAGDSRVGEWSNPVSVTVGANDKTCGCGAVHCAKRNQNGRM